MNKNPSDILTSEQALLLIREIEMNPEVTQRTFALKLQVSLGKINYLINSLIDKGIIEAKNFKNSRNKLAYRYLLTPKGIHVKLELMQKFIQWKTEEYARLKQEIEYYKKEMRPLRRK